MQKSELPVRIWRKVFHRSDDVCDLSIGSVQDGFICPGPAQAETLLLSKAFNTNLFTGRGRNLRVFPPAARRRSRRLPLEKIGVKLTRLTKKQATTSA